MRTAEIKKWREVSKFHFEEMANLGRPNPPASVHPGGTEQTGGSRINFAAPASKKTRPRVGLFGGLAPHTVAAKSPAKSR